MKLNELKEEIATACDMRAKAVLAVQKETFRKLREAIERGERVIIPDFGVFSTKERTAQEGEEPKKSIRFKLHSSDEKAASSESAGDAAAPAPDERKAKRQAKKAAKADAAQAESNGSASPAAKAQQ